MAAILLAGAYEFAARQALMAQRPQPPRAAYDVGGPGRITGMNRPTLLCGTRATGRSADICLSSGHAPLTTRAKWATVAAHLQQEGNLDLVSRRPSPIRQRPEPPIFTPGCSALSDRSRVHISLLCTMHGQGLTPQGESSRVQSGTTC